MGRNQINDHTAARRNRRPHRLGWLQPASAVVMGWSLLLGPAGGGVSAQTTPIPSCAIAPVSDAELRDLFQQPPGVMAAFAAGTPAAFPTAPAGGDLADPATVAAITERVEEIVDCANSGETARYFANFTRAYLVDLVGGMAGENPTAAELDAAIDLAGTPVPAATAIVIYGIDDVRMLPDGRVAATLRFSSGSSRSVFALVDGVWLVDAATPLP